MQLAPSRSVCVFCGSRPGNDPAHAAAAAELGTALAAAGLRLVYGAGDVGLMGAVARAAIAAGGRTLGVIPGHLVPREARGRPPGRSRRHRDHARAQEGDVHERRRDRGAARRPRAPSTSSSRC